LRIGYGIAPAPLAGVIERLRQPFNVNAVAYRGAVAALADRAHQRRTLQMVAAGRRRLSSGLARMGFESVPSRANFVLVRVPGAGASVAAELERRGVIVRPLGSPRLRSYVRITVGTAAQNARVLAAFRSLGYNR
jgi:histidinol-phosphate aminotransferase